jgi:DNA-binding NtrC family response regulator
MSTPLRVLLVEDSKGDANLIVLELQDSGYAPEFERVDTPEAFRAALTRQTWDLIICDYFLPRFSGLDALAMVKESGLDLPFIIVSGVIGEDVAVAAMKSGAYDYVMKGNLARLGPAVQRALQEAEERRARRRAEEAQRQQRVFLLTLFLPKIGKDVLR